MNFSLVFSALFACIALLSLSPLHGQGFGGSYLSFDVSLSQASSQQIQLGLASPFSVEITSGTRIQLTPPDMAKLEARFIRSIQTDTLPDQSCLSTCTFDTLYLSPSVFLLDVDIEVAYFQDGTYEGTSRFGQDVLQAMGKIDLQPSQILIEDIHPRYLTVQERKQLLQQMDLNTQPALPFERGDLNEIRLIKGNTQWVTEQYIAGMEALLSQQPLFCSFPSVDPNVPPQAALARLQTPVTVRYFEPFHAQRAEAVGEAIAFLFAIPLSDVFAEDMLPAYNGTPPVRDYLEVWFQ